MKKLNDIKLYNMIFPIFMLFAFFPIMWLFSIVGNFIIDSIVLLIITLAIYKKINFKVYANTIVSVWLIGFFSDLMGAIYLTVMSVSLDANYYDGNDLGKQILSGIYLATNHSPFDSVWGVVFISSGILLSAICIFMFNYFISFSKTNFTNKCKICASITLAIVTAPYTFLLPKELFY